MLYFCFQRMLYIAKPSKNLYGTFTLSKNVVSSAATFTRSWDLNLQKTDVPSDIHGFSDLQ